MEPREGWLRLDPPRRGRDLGGTGLGAGAAPDHKGTFQTLPCRWRGRWPCFPSRQMSGWGFRSQGWGRGGGGLPQEPSGQSSGYLRAVAARTGTEVRTFHVEDVGGGAGGRPGSPAKSYLQIKALGTVDPGTRVLRRSPQSSPRRAAGPVSTGGRLCPPPRVPDTTRHKPPF